MENAEIFRQANYLAEKVFTNFIFCGKCQISSYSFAKGKLQGILELIGMFKAGNSKQYNDLAEKIIKYTCQLDERIFTYESEE